MTARDVRDLLDRLAEHAPDPAEVFDAALMTRIRRRRRARSVVAATGVTLAATATVGTIAVGQFGWLSGWVTNGEGTAPATQPGVALGGCGSRISPAPASGLRLEMTADMPSTITANAEGYVRGTATLTNRSQEAIRGITGRRPEVTVSRDGIVVATPAGSRDAGKGVNLAPGAIKAYELIVNVRACSREYAGDNGLLQPGRYTLHGQLDVRVQERDGRAVDEQSTVQGGPWEVILR